MAYDIEYVSDLISVAGRQALSMGANAMEVVIPEALREGIEARYETVSGPLERGDPWLMKGLGG